MKERQERRNKAQTQRRRKDNALPGVIDSDEDERIDEEMEQRRQERSEKRVGVWRVFKLKLGDFRRFDNR